MAVKLGALLEPPVARAWGEVLALGVIISFVINQKGVANLTFALLLLAFIAVVWGNVIYVIKKVFGIIGSFEQIGIKKEKVSEQWQKKGLKKDLQSLGPKEQPLA